uniref:Insulinase family protein n=1 Tax=Roseihalotalea indica TaxID=2867963 RepID=A0AA49JIT9_9BACT|nr:insulinase family protein [Tunicatimonas sp. TK19036]
MHKLIPMICLFLLTFGWAEIRAQEMDMADDLSLTNPIPMTDKVIKGKLDNGLTYYIRQNSKPENRVELRLAVNAGSLLEEDSQLGLAHFLEHMAFNGTENFEKNELVSVLQSAGVRFGAHLNAYTSFDETVYMLRLPTADTTMDKGLQILEDWAGGLTLDEEEIDKERGVVIEEWRIGQGAQQRMRDEYFPKLLYGSRYAERLPIGTKEILESFDYATLKQFYQDWYRPDLMALVVVGDVDPQQMEQQIKDRFSELENPAQEKERTVYDIPYHEDTKVSVVTDPEATFNQIILFYKDEEDAKPQEKIQDYREGVVESLFTGMLNERLSELTRQANPPFMNAAAYHGTVLRTKEAYQLFAYVPENGIEQGIKTLLEQNEKVRQFGFTQTELDRYKKQMLTQYERAYNEREKTESDRYASEYVRNFLEDEPIPGIAFEYEFMQEYLPNITLEEVNQLADEWIKSENRVAVVMAPEKEGIEVPTEDEVRAILEEMEGAEVTAYEDEAVAGSLMETPPEPGEVTEEKTLDAIGVTELTLSNGVKVVLKPTDFKDDEIIMTASSPGGHSLYDLETYYSAVNADGIVAQSGIKDFSETALEKYLSDKNARVSPYIGTLTEGFSGNSTPKDLETLLQLTNLYFTAPRQDQEAFQSFISKNKSIYANLLSNPQYYYQDKLSRILSQDNPRGGGFPTQEDWDKVDFEESFEVYNDRFADASDFTFFFVGNFDVEEIKPMLTQYLGSLPATDREETWKDIGVRPPSGVVDEEVHKGTDPKSMVNITFTGELEYNREEAYQLQSLVQALNIKLIEEIREKKSGVYGISASADASKYPYEHYEITVGFPCGPENVEDLTEAVFEEIKKMKENGPTAADLQKVKETQRRDMETNLEDNRYWLRSLQQAYFLDQDPQKIVEYEEPIQSLTAEQLKNTANKYFNFDSYVRVVLLPEEGAASEEEKPNGSGQ